VAFLNLSAKFMPPFSSTLSPTSMNRHIYAHRSENMKLLVWVWFFDGVQSLTFTPHRIVKCLIFFFFYPDSELTTDLHL